MWLIFALYPSRLYQFWDYHPDVGYIVAGGYTASSGYSKAVYISEDYGQTRSFLTNLPYGNSKWQHGCLVIVNTTTIFVAGGTGKA